MTDITFGEGLYVVACGDPAGRVLVSDDGDTFAFEHSGLPDGLAATRVVHDHGIWLVLADRRVWTKAAWGDVWQAGGTTGKPVVEVRSLNGEFWAWSCGYAFGSESPCATRESSELYRSETGMEWATVSVTDDQLSISELIYAEGKYVMTNFGYSSTTSGLWGSTNGVLWEPLVGGRGVFNSVAYGAGRFVAAGDGGRLAHSDDGLSWTGETFPFINSYVGAGIPRYSNVEELDFYGGRFIARSSSYYDPILAESSDGVDWAVSGSLEFEQRGLKIVVLGGEAYYLGVHGFLWKGDDWSTDRQRLLPYQAWDWKGAAASASRLVIAGEGGHVAWSNDGIAFNHLVLPEPAAVTDLVWAEKLGLFLAVGGEGEIARTWRSADGITWLVSDLPELSKPASGVAWSGEQFVVCGADGQLAASGDGVVWQARESGIARSLDNIGWGGGHFVAVGSGAPLIYSADGQEWTVSELVAYPDPCSRPTGLVYGRGLWAFGVDGYAVLTSDFETRRYSGEWSSGSNPVFAFGEFIVADYRYVRSSSDGLEVRRRYDEWYSGGGAYGGWVDHFYRGVEFLNRIFYVGYDGLIGASGEWRDFFSEWQHLHFSAMELADAGISGDDADPDSDGWSNAFEYAFGLDPKAKQEAGRTRLSTRFLERGSLFVGMHAHFLHPWGTQPPGVSVWIEQSKDLNTWREAELSSSPYSIGIGENRLDGVERSFPLRTDEPIFFRLRAEVIRP